MLIDRMRMRFPLPAPTYARLRGCEVAITELLARLQAAAGRPDATIAAIDAFDQVDRLLNDERTSPYAGLLRRPASQLSVEGPEVASFERYLRALVAVGEDALAVDEVVATIQERVASLRRRFSEALPWTTGQHLTKAGLTTERLRRIRRLKDAQRLLRRSETVGRQLEETAEGLSETTAPPTPTALAGNATVAELEATLARRLSEREYASAERSLPDQVRRAMTRHLNALGALNGWPEPGHSADRRLAQQLLRRSVDRRGTDDRIEAGLWFGAIRGADLTRAGDRSAAQWQPAPVALSTSGPSDVAPSTLFVVPINDSFAYVSHHVAGPVRVRNRGIRVGGLIEAALGEASAATIDDGLAALDVKPLFRGLTAHAAWFHTKRPAKLTVLAEAGSMAWYASIDEPGDLELLDDEAWQRQPRGETGLRIVHAPRRGGRSDATVVGQAANVAAVPEWLGWTTVEVITPFQQAPVGWLRSTSDLRDAPSTEREHRFFAALERGGIAAGLRPLGDGILSENRTRGTLYCAPIGQLLDTRSPASEWLNQSDDASLAFLGAVARTLVAVHSAGMALLAVHPRAFAFAPDFLANPEGLVPAATIVHAPLATTLGEPVAGRPSRLDKDLAYPGLGFRGLPPMIGETTVATPVLDAVGFALMCVDTLARPDGDVTARPWEAALVCAHRRASSDSDSRSAVLQWLARQLADSSHWHALMEFLGIMARGESLNGLFHHPSRHKHDEWPSV